MAQEGDEILIEQFKKEQDIFQKAKFLRTLNREKQIRVKDLAKLFGLTSSYVCHILRLNRIPEIVVDGYYARLISISHLFIISRLKDSQVMIGAYEKVLADNLTVLQTEELIREKLYGLKSEGAYLSQTATENFRQTISSYEKNVTTKIIQSRVKSKLVVEIQGSLKDTSSQLKKLMSLIEEWAKGKM